MKIAIVDCGAGNLHSLAKGLALAGDVEVAIETDPVAAICADALVLPGVGAFGSAMERLAPAREQIRDALLGGLPCLGVCLGMQLLFDASEEGAGDGLGVIAGRVERLRARRVPQMGWNLVAPEPAESLAARPFHAYFANGYVCRPRDEGVVTAWSRHEDDRFAAIVRTARTVGVQFHPEKTGRDGLSLLAAWLRAAAGAPAMSPAREAAR
ncbi:MAG: imidazole glycerol phosphate synthase subunit HisH [Candidatus Eisenbacteria bacterium]|nr:imidazole glycerol phosphate synthase subunit HisH [Candidatus Eisenbacteria bacterium]